MSASELSSLSTEQRELLQLLLRSEGGDPAELPILPRESSGPMPLSYAQHRLWYLDQFNPQPAAYNVTKALFLEGALDGEALQKALDSLVMRHEILRTTYHHEDASPMQTVQEPRPVELRCFDWRDSGTGPRDPKVRRLLEDEARRAFDLTCDLMMRAAWVRLAARQHVVLLTFHHIAADAWSLGIVLGELEEFYKTHSTGGEPALPPLPIQYADYAAWERQRHSNGAIEQDIEYWKAKLAGAPAVLELPTDRPRPAERAMRGAIEQRTLPEGLCAELKKVAAGEGATFFVALLAAFETLMYRYSGQSDFCIGSPITGRTKKEAEGLVGFFLNTLVFRADFSRQAGFREIIRRVQEEALEAFAHQETPFERLVETLHPQRRASHTPLFQVMFILQDAQTHRLNLSGVAARVCEVDLGAARFDLNLTAQDTGEGLHCCLEYDTDLFDRETAERMLGHFEMLLRSAVAEPDRPVAALPILTGHEQRQLLLDWNQTASEYPRRCIHELFEARALATPDRAAVIFEGGEISYGELQRRSAILAQCLEELGARGKLVGLFCERGIEVVAGLLGVLSAGAAYVPLDPAYPKDRLAFMVEDAGLAVLLTQSDLLDNVPAQVPHVIALDTFDWSARPGDAPRSAVSHGDLAYVLYTSGSTGNPKGVAIEHGALVNLLEAIRRETGYSERDRLLAVTTLSFDIAGLEIYLPLMTGSTMILASRAAASDANRLAELIGASGATFLQATPTTWRLLLENGWQGKQDLTILCGGEKMPRSLANELVRRARVAWNVYGPTETTIWSTIVRVEQGEGPVPIGRPLANTQVYVLDSRMQPAPAGAPGELYIGGDGLARGYLHRPELSAERFVANPFGSGRLYRTGDLVRWRSNGNLEFLRRLDDQVKLRGFRIELGEIEAGLMRHEAVRAACAVVREDSPGDSYIAAYYVAHQGRSVSGQELREVLSRLLPDYMVPSRFVPVSEFPLTPNGKIDRRALPAPPAAQPLAASTAAPLTDMQRLIAEIWARALGIEGVGEHDNFFDLGGHSLLSMQVIRELHQRTGVRLSPREMVFQSLGQLAALYEERSSNGKRTGGLLKRLSGVVRKAISKGA
jgi:amino acid adenylation domain-containing protein